MFKRKKRCRHNGRVGECSICSLVALMDSIEQKSEKFTNGRGEEMMRVAPRDLGRVIGRIEGLAQ